MIVMMELVCSVLAVIYHAPLALNLRPAPLGLASQNLKRLFAVGIVNVNFHWLLWLTCKKNCPCSDDICSL